MNKKIVRLGLVLMLCMMLVHIPAFATDQLFSVSAKNDIVATPTVINALSNHAVITLESADAGKQLPAYVSVKLGEETLATEAYTYDRDTGIITILTPIIDNIVISEAHPVIVSSTCDGDITRETVAFIDADTEYTLQLKAPNGFTFPSSITVRVDGTALKIGNNNTYTYDSATGTISFATGIITGETIVQVQYPAGTLIVNNVELFKNGKVKDYSAKGMSYNPKTNILTLDHAEINKIYKDHSGNTYGIYSNMGHLTIALKGENTISLPAPTGKKSFGIYASGGLSMISLDEHTAGSLRIETPDTKSSSSLVHIYGIYAGMASDSMLIDNLTLNITIGNVSNTSGSVSSVGICVDDCAQTYNGLQIRNSTVVVETENITASTRAYNAGIVAGDKENNHITLKNSSVSVSSGDAVAVQSAVSYGISGTGELEVLENSKVAIHSGQTESDTDTALSYGLHNKSMFLLSDGQVDVSTAPAVSLNESHATSIGVLANHMSLEYGNLKTQAADYALLSKGTQDFAAELQDWYQWKTEANGAYVLSSDKAFQPRYNYTYLHIIPVTTVPEADLSSNTALPEGQFSDVHLVKHWAADAIDVMVERKLLAGFEDRTFRPNDTATRSQIATILWRMEGAPVLGQGKSGAFIDVPENVWYTEAVEWAAAVGISEGKGDGTFGPDDEITREQLAAMLYRYEQYKGGGFTGTWMFQLNYADREDVSPWAYEAVCWMTMNGIFNGNAVGKLEPKSLATRGHVAQVIANYIASN